MPNSKFQLCYGMFTLDYTAVWIRVTATQPEKKHKHAPSLKSSETLSLCRNFLSSWVYVSFTVIKKSV